MIFSFIECSDDSHCHGTFSACDNKAHKCVGKNIMLSNRMTSNIIYFLFVIRKFIDFKLNFYFLECQPLRHSTCPERGPGNWEKQYCEVSGRCVSK